MKWLTLPSWNTFLIYIGGIPTIITTAVVTFMVFVTARNKAFSFKDLKELQFGNKILNKKEEQLSKKILSCAPGVKRLYNWYIGETNYYDLVNRR